ncbi:unnamed protein product [Sphenostylis stenocarpa]|uniref:Transmembrane protein n=1 Tax=Sphenostylis stenocarpa TaxID=92480 RepID=A0AA86SCR6_9FABA|nr:unnamed protein product [Sphenostylis stenocarpa]
MKYSSSNLSFVSCLVLSAKVALVSFAMKVWFTSASSFQCFLQRILLDSSSEEGIESSNRCFGLCIENKGPGHLGKSFHRKRFTLFRRREFFGGKSGVGLRDCLEIVGNIFDGLTYLEFMPPISFSMDNSILSIFLSIFCRFARLGLGNSSSKTTSYNFGFVLVGVLLTFSLGSSAHSFLSRPSRFSRILAVVGEKSPFLVYRDREEDYGNLHHHHHHLLIVIVIIIIIIMLSDISVQGHPGSHDFGIVRFILEEWLIDGRGVSRLDALARKYPITDDDDDDDDDDEADDDDDDEDFHSPPPDPDKPRMVISRQPPPIYEKILKALKENYEHYYQEKMSKAPQPIQTQSCMMLSSKKNSLVRDEQILKKKP